jgi:hypothetical protein
VFNTVQIAKVTIDSTGNDIAGQKVQLQIKLSITSMADLQVSKIG